MIEKLKRPVKIGGTTFREKTNELVDAINELQLAKDVMFNRIDMLNDAICDIRNRITTLDDPTYHQEAQDMYDNAILDALKDKQVDVVVEPADKFAEQKRWLHKLCWFWNDACCDYIGVLYEIHDLDETPFENDLGEKYQHCKPVKPDDDIIYKGE